MQRSQQRFKKKKSRRRGSRRGHNASHYGTVETLQTSQIKQSTLETTAPGYHHPDLRSCTWVVGGREKSLKKSAEAHAKVVDDASRRSLKSQRQGRQRAGSADSASNGHNDGDNKNMGGESLVNDERKRKAALSLSHPLCAVSPSE